MQLRGLSITVAGILALTTGVSTSRADIFENILLGLTETGFNFVGNENLLSGGADLVVTRTFNGETLDFGATELTLFGTPTFTFSTGGRGLQVMDFSLNTANQPLRYTLISDAGSQRTAINGSFLMDLTGSINSFGFYDLTLDVSSRQDVTQDGRFSGETFENDFDLGPISVRGNMFADLLGALTDPVFQILGVENFFYSFSGAARFQDQLDQLGLAGLDLGSLTGSLFGDPAALGGLSKSINDMHLAAGQLDAMTTDPSQGQRLAAVPEPATLMLLLAGGALVLRRSR